MADIQGGAADFEIQLLNPASSFRQPKDVIARTDLGRRQKIDILCRWAYDAVELAVAEEEGMGGGEASQLGAVIEALHNITGGFDTEHSAPTKHAGICVSPGLE